MEWFDFKAALRRDMKLGIRDIRSWLPELSDMIGAVRSRRLMSA